MNVIVMGAAGRMGGRILSLLAGEGHTLVGALEQKGHCAVGRDAGETAGCGRMGIDIGDDLAAILTHAEVVIDFTIPDATLPAARLCAKAGVPVVIGTTGLSPSEVEELRSLGKKIPIVFSPNMSIGVNVLLKTLADLARVLGEEYDIEVMEIHHRMKKDAPSGTALRMAQLLAQARGAEFDRVGRLSRQGNIGERKKGEIGVQSLRGGDVVGEHTVIFAGPGERLELTHRAHSRDNFARGSLRAAAWVVRQPPGFYDMQDVLGLNAGQKK
jgi:4-hydroxy-tetrahydrodipicolinate reductase